MKNYNDLVKLIADVNAHNTIATDAASVCDYQDMIAHSTDEQLTELANDDKTRFAFYWIYSIAYRVDTVLTFYAKHDDRIYNLRLERETLQCDNDNLKTDCNRLLNQCNEANAENKELTHRAVAAEEKVEELEAEIIKLKAKLYDLTTK